MPSAARRPRPILLGLLLALACGLAVGPTVPAFAEAPPEQAVQAFLDAYRHRHGIPGIEATLVKDGRIVLDAGSGAGVTAHTPMGIGSTTKPVTAFAVLQLVDAGRLELDDPVVEHLPEFRLADPRAASITVRQLLSHTSGLPNPTLVPPADSPAQRLAQLRNMRLGSDPGTHYAYSNLNYQVAARLIEVVSGQGYADYLHDHVFAPLGMTDTVAAVTTTGQPAFADGNVTAYGLSLALPELQAMNAGAGDIVSTSHDLGLWLAMYQRAGTTSDGTRLLSAELIRESLSPQPAAGRNSLGWQPTQTSVPARIGKDGTLTRFSSRIDLVPSSGYGVAVVLNSYTPTLKHPFEISSGIIALTEGRQPTPGVPWASLIDLVLGVITVGVVLLTVRGVVRARVWVERRRSLRLWRFTVWLIPQLLAPAAAIVVFGILPLGNAASVADAFGLWPAAMILLLVAALGGLMIVVGRIRWRGVASTR